MSATREKSKPAGATAPTDLTAAFAEMARQTREQVAQFMQRSGGALIADEMGIGQAFMDLAQHMMQDPMKVVQAQMKLWQDYMLLFQTSMVRAFGHAAEPVAAPLSSDKRFRHEDWESNFVFDYVKQSYLLAARYLHGAVGSVEGLDEKTRKKVDFFTRQYVDALSPTNFVLTNPEVLRETIESGGQNLIKGLTNLLQDLERGGGQSIRIRMTDTTAFKLGENIANTRGKVVYENELMQLLQYDPTTEQVLRKPLLIVPPWINKFYILDLREKNSFIKWAVDQGHTVFVISWVNPDVNLAHKNFEDYLLEGPIDAIEQIRKATGEDEVNTAGYCLGGTLLAGTLGYLAAKGEQRIASATFFTTMIDFAEPGELEIFLDDRSISALEKKMKQRGYLEGHEMAGTFNMLRANDLIWSFVINNYLLGKDPFPFDLLHWNSDSTRLPAAMHTFYLRNCYQRNLLKDPGGVTMAGVPIDLGRVKTPVYFISTIEDHIAPWKSTYKGTHLFAGPVKFVLGGSGHIAGVINPPAAKKYGYWTNTALPAGPDSWFDGATQHHGSWWLDWQKWVSALAGGKVAARVPGSGGLPVLEDAPGSYVKARLDAPAPAAG
ncbi:MAG TPA: class I poly(R)-hydroxyalkanoic acid synthase [Burkholderiales bacterium]|nr:class I poly(R)-hydroxyalkanoic acid synthase [Burkholderiales bacterium]